MKLVNDISNFTFNVFTLKYAYMQDVCVPTIATKVRNI